MTPLQTINKIATSKTVEYVYINGSKMIPVMEAIQIISLLDPNKSNITANYKTNQYKMGGTWEDYSRMVVIY